MKKLKTSPKTTSSAVRHGIFGHIPGSKQVGGNPGVAFRQDLEAQGSRESARVPWLSRQKSLKSKILEKVVLFLRSQKPISSQVNHPYRPKIAFLARNNHFLGLIVRIFFLILDPFLDDSSIFSIFSNFFIWNFIYMNISYEKSILKKHIRKI